MVVDPTDQEWVKWSRLFDRFDGAGAQITYKEGYKYQLHGDHSVVTAIIPARSIHSEYISLSTIGLLTMKRGYAWDGASPPAIDTKNFIRGSLYHDALYQLMREHGLDHCHREEADQLLRTICREDGMSAIRAWWVYAAVRFGGGAAVSYDNPVRYAP